MVEQQPYNRERDEKLPKTAQINLKVSPQLKAEFDALSDDRDRSEHLREVIREMISQKETNLVGVYKEYFAKSVQEIIELRQQKIASLEIIQKFMDMATSEHDDIVSEMELRKQQLAEVEAELARQDSLQPSWKRFLRIFK